LPSKKEKKEEEEETMRSTVQYSTDYMLRIYTNYRLSPQ
jgi:hypothetical protein